MKRLTLLLALILFTVSTFSQYEPSVLHNKRYTYKQLIHKGYDTQPFKGKMFITYKKYLEITKADTSLIKSIEALADKYSKSSDIREQTVAGILYSILSIYEVDRERDLFKLIIQFNEAILLLPKPAPKVDSSIKKIQMPVKVVTKSNNNNSHNVDFKADRKIYTPPVITGMFTEGDEVWYNLDNGNTISKANYDKHFTEPAKGIVITDKKYKGETVDWKCQLPK